jgi:predicted MPP superfamily phosphohydrolase
LQNVVTGNTITATTTGVHAKPLLEARKVVVMLHWVVGGLLAGAGALATVYALLIERARVQLDRFTVEVDRPGLPPQGLTILHLSDLHCRGADPVQRRKLARLSSLLAGEEFDILTLTGDLIHDATGFPVALALIESLRPRLGGFSCPGNHDYSEYAVWGMFGPTWREGGKKGRFGPADVGVAARKLWDFGRKVLRNELVRLPVASNDLPAMHAALSAHGVEPLVNRAVRLQADGLDLWVAGVDDLTEGQPDLAAALAETPEGALLVLLAHNPDVWLDSRAGQAALILSGHTHGGQVCLPLVGVAHTQGTHLPRRRPAGWFQRGATRMFVSCGLGESIPLRFGVRPQAALIRLVTGWQRDRETRQHGESGART